MAQAVTGPTPEVVLHQNGSFVGALVEFDQLLDGLLNASEFALKKSDRAADTGVNADGGVLQTGLLAGEFIA